MMSDVVRGLITRPPVVDVADLTGSATVLKFDDIEIDGVKYLVGFREGVLKVWDTAGNTFVVNNFDIAVTIASGGTFTESSKNLNKTAAFASYTWASGDRIYITGGTAVVAGSYEVASKTDDDNIVLVLDITSDASDPTDVTAEDATTLYLGDNMQFSVYDDTIYCTNTDKVVAEDDAIDSSDYLENQCMIQCLGGSFGRDMTIELIYTGVIEQDFTNATFTNSTKNLNKTGAFASYVWASGDRIMITAGTACTFGSYEIASRTDDDNIVLVLDITTDASSPINVAADYFRKCLHNVPDGPDPDKVNADYIMTQLTDGMGTGAPIGNNNTITGTLVPSTIITKFRNVMWIFDDTERFALTVTDGDDGKVLRSHINTAKDIEQLVRFAPEGVLVKVDGEDEESADDFWMRFDVEDETTIGNGFGTEGTWRESVNAFEATSLDFRTMPHILFELGGEFFFERNLWQERRVGDSDSNPHPSFVGETISDVGGFQSRIMFTAGANVIASRTNIPSDFYIKSIVASADSDPLDFASTTESEVALKWMVPFDRDMLVMSEKHQFIISGTTALTPDNAAMVLTTDFEMAGQSRPSSTGRTILFPYQIGVHGGLKEFFSSDEIATNGADNITETLSHYLHGDITQIATSTNFNTALIRTDSGLHHDGADVAATIYVYKYLWEGIEKKQSSMSRWTLPLDVKYAFWDNETIFVIMRDGNDYVLGSLDMDYATHAIGFTPTLDLQEDLTANGSFEVTYPFTGATFVAHTDCTNPGAQVTEASESGSGPYTYTFAEADVPSGAVVVAGLPYDSFVIPTMPFIRDRNGTPVVDTRLVVTDFTVVYELSGTINSLMTSKYRADKTHSNIKAITVGDVEDVDQIGIRSGDFTIPWGEQSEWSTLRLTATGIRPMAILEIEWRGQPFKRGK